MLMTMVPDPRMALHLDQGNDPRARIIKNVIILGIRLAGGTAAGQSEDMLESLLIIIDINMDVPPSHRCGLTLYVLNYINMYL